ncbi:C-type isolectin Sp-CL4-like [Synchiropus picturatus]
MRFVKLTAFLLVVLFTSDSAAGDVEAMCASYPAKPCQYKITYRNSDYKDPDQWFQLGKGSCVKVVTLPQVNWVNAETACSSFSYRYHYGHLVSIRTTQELNGTICATYRKNSYRQHYWIALHKMRGVKNLWTDGTENGFINWGKNQPNLDFLPQYCVKINYVDWGYYDDVDCFQYNSFVCQVRFE